MTITNKKWKKLLGGFIISFILLLFFNIAPSYYDAFLDLLKWFDMKEGEKNALEYEARIKNGTSELNMMKAKMNSMLSKMGDSCKTSFYIDELNSFAVSSGILLSSIKTKPIEKRDNLLVQPLEISLEGNYTQFFHFSKSVENAKRIFVINNINIKHAENNRPGINAFMKMDIYLNL